MRGAEVLNEEVCSGRRVCEAGAKQCTIQQERTRYDYLVTITEIKERDFYSWK